MSIKNDQISLYCHFNKIIKGPATSFQSPAVNQKHVKNVCQTTHWYLMKFHFDSAQDSKEIRITNFHYFSNAYDDVSDFEIGAFYENTKIKIF